MNASTSWWKATSRIPIRRPSWTGSDAHRSGTRLSPGWKEKSFPHCNCPRNETGPLRPDDTPSSWPCLVWIEKQAPRQILSDTNPVSPHTTKHHTTRSEEHTSELQSH